MRKINFETSKYILELSLMNWTWIVYFLTSTIECKGKIRMSDSKMKKATDDTTIYGRIWSHDKNVGVRRVET